MTSHVITVRCGGKGLKLPAKNKNRLIHEGVQFTEMDNRNNARTPRECYNAALLMCNEDILIFTHDDLTIHDINWHERVMTIMTAHPDIVACGLGGALGLGVSDLYKKPYKLDDMARQTYLSNQTDAEVHGNCYSGLCDVSVLDAFFMAVSHKFLVSTNGWPKQLTHHCLDLWLACEVARAKKRMLMTGVSCTHHGGGTSIKPVYANAKWLQGGSLDRDHQTPHEWIYDKYRDVLPLSITQ